MITLGRDMKLYVILLGVCLFTAHTALAGEIDKCHIAEKVIFADQACDGEIVSVENTNIYSSNDNPKGYPSIFI